MKQLTLIALLAGATVRPALAQAGIDSLLAAGSAALGEGRRDEAIRLFIRAAELEPRPIAAADLRLEIARLLTQVRQNDAARAMLAAQLPVYRGAGLDSLVGYTHILIGEAWHAERRFAEALRSYHDGVGWVRRQGNRQLESHALNDIGAALMAVGQLDSATSYLNRSVRLARRTKYQAIEASALSNLGRLQQTTGRPDSALALFAAALRPSRAIGDVDGEATILNNMGFSHQLAGRPRPAIELYTQTLAMKTTSARDRALALTNLGRALLALGATDSALTVTRQAAAVAGTSAEPWSRAWALDDLGEIFRVRGQLDSAEVYLRRAEAAHREANEPARIGLTLYHLALAARARGRFDDALALFDSASTLRGTVRAQAGDDLGRARFADQDAALFSDWGLTWLAVPNLTASARFWGALLAVERGRARALLDLLPAGRGNAADEQGRIERLFKRAEAEREVVVSYHPTEDTLLVFLAVPGQPQALLRIPLGSDSLERLVAGLDEELGIDRGLTKRGAGSRGVGVRRSQSEAILRGPSAVAMARLLFPPPLVGALAEGGEILIAAGGRLGLVPFAALPQGDEAAPLGASVAVRVAPSLAMVAVADERADSAGQRGRTTRRALVVGSPAAPAIVGGRVLRPLPGARAEAVDIGRLLGVRPLLGASAGKAALRQRWASAEIIHLATHGLAHTDEAHTRSSFLLVAGPTSAAAMLSLGELTDDPAFASTASLVVLSACETAVGAVRSSEGAMGFQRALLGRGAQSVLASLWPVSDEATRILMHRFYQHWRLDADLPSKAEALRRAQGDVRSDQRFRHPFFWAGFTLAGGR